MIIDKVGIQITIADDNPMAKKIEAGHDFDIVDGELKIGNMGTELKTKWQIRNKVKQATTLNEVKQAIIALLEI